MNGLLMLLLLGGNLLLNSFPVGQGHVQVNRPADRAIEKSVTVKATAAEVWRAWTTPAGMKEFMGVNSNIELKFGGRYEILFNKVGLVGQQGSEGCQVLSYIPEMLSFSWNSPPTLPTMRNQRTFVVVTLAEDAGKTTVVLRHAGWGTDAEWDKAFAYFENAWPQVLQALQERFESGPTKEEDTPKAAPAKPDLSALDKMATMVGGTWRGELKGPEGPLLIEFTYKRHPDGKGVIGEGVIGKGSKEPLWVHSQFGWDPVAKAVYYFDTHDSETLYFGHVNLEKEDMVFTFSPIGMLPQVFQSRGRLVDHDTYQAIIRDDKGTELVGFTLKRK